MIPKVNCFYVYTGPNKTDLSNGETVRVTAIWNEDEAHCSNMNMPLSGVFSGFIKYKHLKEEK